ncbi:MAG TPA: glutamate-1-semialdehyde 2,1-aminomutase [Planctomicrobium sp.]|nr:glutamate-1-semialdehyde 2,1-aminomutase [Planctomicrobium sp.]
MSHETFDHSGSQAAFERAQKIIPGGVNSPARAFGGVGGTPVFIARGEGPYLYDLDGNQYLDYVGSWGPHILGHCHPEVISALQNALEYGTSFGAPTESESVLAEKIIDAVPSIEKVRMVNSGTEATMSALRVARGFTGRDKIIKFAGCYHGHVDSLLVQAGSGALTLGTPSSPGIPAGATQDTLILEYNDVADLETVFQQHGDELAALILEPVVGNMGVVVPTQEFLQACRDLCTRHGTVLIFDEVMTGFRVAFGGAQEYFGITPDMTTLGKIVGGGLPVGAYGGRAEIMNCVSPVGPVYQAGTLSGNPLAMACGIATLDVLKKTNPYPQLESRSNRLCSGLSELCQRYSIPHSVARVGSMFTLFFNPEPVTSYRISAKNDTQRFSRYFHAMLDRGVYLPCSQFEANFVSAAHTDEQIEKTLQAAGDVLGNLNS